MMQLYHRSVNSLTPLLDSLTEFEVILWVEWNLFPVVPELLSGNSNPDLVFVSFKLKLRN